MEEEQKPSWKAISVVSKETGKIIQIKDYRFNPDLHETIQEAEKAEIKEEKDEKTEEAEIETSPWICETCGKVCKSPAGLAVHTKSHK